MFNWRRLAVLPLAVLLVANLDSSGHKANAADCGDISIASMNWASAEMIAHIDLLILSVGFGCNATLASGDVMPDFSPEGEAPTVDLYPEIWVNAIQEPLDRAVADGDLFFGAKVLSDGGYEGWWIPKYLSDEHPQIRSVEDALTYPELFELPDDEGISGVHNCPAGWPCQVASANLFRAFGAQERGFTLVDTGSAAGLDASIARAYKDKAGWLGYYWSPTPLLGRYEMVPLDMGEHQSSHWQSCTSVPECAEPQINSWPANDVYTLYTRDFSTNAGAAIDYVSKRQWSNEVVNSLLVWMADNQATGQEVAYHFLENYKNVWRDWVSPATAFKIHAAL